MFSMTKRLTKVNLSVLFSLLLSGCADADAMVPEGYQFNSRSTNGLVVFSVVCQTPSGQMRLSLDAFDDTDRQQVSFNCSSPKNGALNPVLKIVRLSPGFHYFSGVAKQLGGMLYADSTDFTNIYFRVKQGEVTYIGRVVLTGQESFFPNKLSIENAQREDIPLLKKTEPFIDAPIVVRDPFIL